MIATLRRGSRWTAAALLTLGLAGPATLAGCSAENASANCASTSECTITFQRNADKAKVSVLGVDISVVSATDDSVTLAVGGQQVTVKRDASASVGSLTVNLTSISDSEIVVKVTRS
ncbi:MAG: hypothetical protein HOU81_04325 [Hamadaea sp.]|uniref:hypothetical protein n=1 Tax=Hamadaea sp. TaxID=2024425 RepID=UPI001831E516|nr:hypothetical protein [Hamadaea sp.]NUR70025.1 hypothetical protein [Hamadaea sp.]NUT19334.1 hypothetical protein [Hamadaea sp.]